MGVIDKAIRILLGIFILIVWGLLNPTWWCFIGLIPLITGVSGYSPLYQLLGIYKNDKKQLSPKKESSKDIKNSLKSKIKNSIIKSQNYSKNNWHKQKFTAKKDAVKEIFTPNYSKESHKPRDHKRTVEDKLFSKDPLFKE
ncbi:MAG: DUF2892 domain-containing protein [Campylobacter sp.]|nr:DUF2892 domain-containing protein [Campylobacter sp.]